MNTSAMMKKLQRAILHAGLVVKINSSQFYSDEQKRMITVWTISTPTLTQTTKGWRTKDYEILRTSSGIEIVKCLSEIYQQIRGG